MEEIYCKLAENGEELSEAFEVTRQVFVVEQGISEDLVYDNYDNEAIHLIVKQGGCVIGTARVRFLKPGEAKLERMAILPLYRLMGIGKTMVSFLIETLNRRRVEKLILHSQYDVVEFYNKCGFSVVGSPFMEAGIKHIRMEKKLAVEETERRD